ncbi:DUF3817 domain-containing protein [Streptomyces sp. LP05-1]|uniref:DUF3817 domain-containing protein n=1 Tax=Streptomyces pyxinae TaxID=2970734 RepID=A0ABT2CB10_9ACTN|nr:DUF3817 domain-containing protein [Streptomyces sp. LP05-1]MCS0634599.1 DUF3817 domain-containing protein [Streptomyces sp. LP05-1]
MEPANPREPLPLLRVAAATELVSLALLPANLCTVHLPALATLLGPLHGCAYLVAVAAVRRHDRASLPVRLLALLPGAGGLLALRRLDRAAAATA